MIDADFGVEQRLLAYIAPRKPATANQEEAFQTAVEAQLDYESGSEAAGIPGNVTEISNDGVSMRFAEGSASLSYCAATISPVAWSILRNAGLISYALPTARRP